MQIGEDELIGLVLGFAMVAAAMQSRLSKALRDRRASATALARKKAQEGVDAIRKLHGDAVGDIVTEGFVHAAEHAAVTELASKRSGLDFLALVVNILQRILVAITVQLLAASVRAQQESRLVRTVSLIGLAIFFVFVESLTTRHL